MDTALSLTGRLGVAVVVMDTALSLTGGLGVAVVAMDTALSLTGGLGVAVVANDTAIFDRWVRCSCSRNGHDTLLDFVYSASLL